MIVLCSKLSDPSKPWVFSGFGGPGTSSTRTSSTGPVISHTPINQVVHSRMRPRKKQHHVDLQDGSGQPRGSKVIMVLGMLLENSPWHLRTKSGSGSQMASRRPLVARLWIHKRPLCCSSRWQLPVASPFRSGQLAVCAALTGGQYLHLRRSQRGLCEVRQHPVLLELAAIPQRLLVP